jgi:hypothetical protein
MDMDMSLSEKMIAIKKDIEDIFQRSEQFKKDCAERSILKPCKEGKRFKVVSMEGLTYTSVNFYSFENDVLYGETFTGLKFSIPYQIGLVDTIRKEILTEKIIFG